MATEHGRDLAAALAELLPGWTVYRDRSGVWAGDGEHKIAVRPWTVGHGHHTASGYDLTVSTDCDASALGETVARVCAALRAEADGWAEAMRAAAVAACEREHDRHEAAALEDGQTILCPSLVGTSEFSRRLGLRGQPGQLAFLVGEHGVHGLTVFRRRVGTVGRGL